MLCVGGFITYAHAITHFRYHFMNSIGLFTAQFSFNPIVTACLFVTGMAFFCGAGYISAVVPDEEAKKYTLFMPVGGITLMLAWFTHVV